MVSTFKENGWNKDTEKGIRKKNAKEREIWDDTLEEVCLATY
jgi:hypothetical protein